MAWIYLVIAGLFEVVWVISLKYTEGFTRLIPSIITVAGMITSFGLLSLSLKVLPLGTAYAVWTGIGVVGTVVIGMFFLGESKEVLKTVFIVFIIIGIVGLKYISPH